ncbi:hypothetical protein DFS33DRAFT_1385562 [Desarmillaria ectypa]|nr:hypothetical protein DFS33DRAFT_1385562 [Desarmillaria ectypa]
MFSLRQPVLAVAALSIGMNNALTGDAIWYTPNGGYRACGAPLQNSGYIVALSGDQYVGGAHCWKHIVYGGRTLRQGSLNSDLQAARREEKREIIPSSCNYECPSRRQLLEEGP